MESVFNEATGEIESLLQAQGYSYYLVDDEKLELRSVDTLAPVAPAGTPVMGQLNRFVTRRSPQEVRELAEAARTDVRAVGGGP